MADQATKRFEITIPMSLFRQLQHLAQHSAMGAAPPEVARFILTERVMQLFGPAFLDTIPPFDRLAGSDDGDDQSSKGSSS
jgi:hypothetical protein